VVDRDVSVRPGMHGTACLSGYNLPTDKALAAYDRVDRLARAAKSAGDTRNLAQLRADAHLDLLAGRPFQLSPSIDPITAEADARHPRDPDDDSDSRSETGNRDGAGTTGEEPIGSGVFGDADVPEADSRLETGNRDGIDTRREEPIGCGVFGDTDVPEANSRSETGNRDAVDTKRGAEADSRLQTGKPDQTPSRDGAAMAAPMSTAATRFFWTAACPHQTVRRWVAAGRHAHHGRVHMATPIQAQLAPMSKPNRTPPTRLANAGKNSATKKRKTNPVAAASHRYPIPGEKTPERRVAMPVSTNPTANIVPRANAATLSPGSLGRPL
jgi:hypothetical protein